MTVDTANDPLLQGIDGGYNLVVQATSTAIGTVNDVWSSVFIVIGRQLLGVPFKGGVMVPSLDVILPASTDSSGALGIASVRPAGVPSGLPTYVRAWLVDAAGPRGFAASNALSATTP